MSSRSGREQQVPDLSAISETSLSDLQSESEIHQEDASFLGKCESNLTEGVPDDALPFDRQLVADLGCGKPPMKGNTASYWSTVLGSEYAAENSLPKDYSPKLERDFNYIESRGDNGKTDRIYTTAALAVVLERFSLEPVNMTINSDGILVAIPPLPSRSVAALTNLIAEQLRRHQDCGYTWEEDIANVLLGGSASNVVNLVVSHRKKVTIQSMTVIVQGDGSVRLYYPGNIWCEETAYGFLDAFCEATSQISLNPSSTKLVRTLNVVSQAMKQHQMNLLCGRCIEPDIHMPLMHELFERSCDSSPHGIALSSTTDGELTYQALDLQANQLANWLINKGVKVEDRVGIHLPRGVAQIVVLLGILKAGGAYVPLDLESSKTRTRTIRQDSGMLLCVDKQTWARKEFAKYPTHRPVNVELTPNNLCYVLYTAGSTGRPKGVAVMHRGLGNLGLRIGLHRPGERRRVLMTSRLTWDTHVTQYLWAVIHPGTLCVLSETEAHDLDSKVEDLVNQLQVTMMLIPPSLLSTMRPERVPTLSVVVNHGDVLTRKLVLRWHQHVTLVNMYGPTEATCCVTDTLGCDLLTANGSPTIGKVIDNTEIYILNEHGLLQPRGAPGEMYIAGYGLAREYLNLPDKTAEVFRQNHLSSTFDRMYKTGDSARLLGDGQIHLFGRIDNAVHVTIRGCRIELEAIQSVIESSKDVNRCFVLVENDEVYAFVEGSASNSNLMRLCEARLVDYMVPARIYVTEKFPVDHHGKLEKKNLLQLLKQHMIDAVDLAAPVAVAARQSEMTFIWSQVLGIPENRVGISSDFFSDLGGTLVTAGRVVSLARENSSFHDISVRRMYSARTIEDLVASATSTSNRRRVVWDEEEVWQPKIQDLEKNRAREKEEELASIAKGEFKDLCLNIVSVMVALLLCTLSLIPFAFTVGYSDKTRTVISFVYLILSFIGAGVILLAGFTWGLRKVAFSGVEQQQQHRLTVAMRVADKLWWCFVLPRVADTFSGTWLLPAFYRMFGASIGKGVFLEDTCLRVPELVSIGDFSTIESGVAFNNWRQVDSGTCQVGRIVIGSYCSVQPNVVLDEGCELKDGVVVEPLVHIPPYRVVAQNSRVAGTLAVVVETGLQYARDEYGETCWIVCLLELVFIMSLTIPYLVRYIIRLVVLVFVVGEENPLEEIAIYLAISSPVAEFVLALFFSLCGIIIRWIILGSSVDTSIEVPMRSAAFSKRWFGVQIFDQVASSWEGTIFGRFLSKLYGAKLMLRSEFCKLPQEPLLFKEDGGLFTANGVQVRNVCFKSGRAYFGSTNIGDDCVLFGGAVLKPKVTVGSRATIGAVTAISDAVNAGEVVFGNPNIRQSASGLEVDWKVQSRSTCTLLWEDTAMMFVDWIGLWFPVYMISIGLFYGLEFTETLSSPGLVVAVIVGVPIGGLIYLSFHYWLVVLLWKKVFIGEFQAGVLTISLFKWNTFNQLYSNGIKPILQLLDSPMLTRKVIESYGADVSPGVRINPSALMLEFDLLKVGPNTTVGEMATILCHKFQHGRLSLEPVVIGADSSIATRAVVLPGCHVKNNVDILPLTSCLSGEVLATGRTYAGSPPEPITISALANVSSNDQQETASKKPDERTV